MRHHKLRNELFRASWQRMVLLASIIEVRVQGDGRPLIRARHFDRRFVDLQPDKAATALAQEYDR